MSVTIQRPIKHKGPNREYLIVEYEGVSQNVILAEDGDVLKDWPDILELTIGKREFTQRRATQKDVDDGRANAVDELIKDNWNRLEVIDYTTMKRQSQLDEYEDTRTFRKMKNQAKTKKMLETLKLDDELVRELEEVI